MSEGDLPAAVRAGSVEGHAGSACAARERLLLAAVLDEALTCYRRYALARDEHGRALFAETEEWFRSDDHTSVFAFESVCDALDLDAAYVRRGLRQWREQAALAAPLRRVLRPEPQAAARPRTGGAVRDRASGLPVRARGGRR